MPLYDVNRVKRSAEFLRRIQKRLPLTAHVYGEAYSTRYKLHAYSGHELSTVKAMPSWSFGGARSR